MTIYDIAKAAGVSASTVSKVLNDKQGINEKTRDKVKKILEENNYSPNKIVKDLVIQPTKIIGVLVEDIRVSHHAESAYIIEQQITKAGYTCITLSTGSSPERKAQYIKILEQRRVEAVILMGSMFALKEVKQSIEKHLPNIPVAIINGYIDLPNVYGVLIDEEKGVENCTDLLFKKGCKNVAFAINSYTPSNNNKLKGFKTSVLKNKTDGSNILVYGGSYKDIDLETTIQRGFEVTEKILEENPNVDGIVYSIDLLAIGGLQFLESKNIEVPKQVSVIGVDNSLYGKICRPKLTSLDNRFVEISRNTCKALLDVLNKKEVSHKIILPAQIIERESS